MDPWQLGRPQQCEIMMMGHKHLYERAEVCRPHMAIRPPILQRVPGLGSCQINCFAAAIRKVTGIRGKGPQGSIDGF